MLSVVCGSCVRKALEKRPREWVGGEPSCGWVTIPFLPSGLRPQQGLVRALFCLLHLQRQADTQVSVHEACKPSGGTRRGHCREHSVSEKKDLTLLSSFCPSLLKAKLPPLIVPCFLLFLLCPAQRDKFVEIDLKPVCKHCYEKMPEEFKRRLAKREREAKDKDKQKKKKPVCLWAFLSLCHHFYCFLLWLVL